MLSNDSHDSLINKLIDQNIILFDKTKTYRLKSGAQSCLYIDFRRAISFPSIQESLCTLYCNEITKPFAMIPDFIVGVPDGAVPMAAMISAKLSIPMLMVRKEPKQHGTGNLIEGNIRPGATVLVIEDIITTGGSCINTVSKLRNAGLNPINIICLLKRSRISLGAMHGTEAARGIVSMKSLLSLKDIEFKVKLRESKLCIAVDTNTMASLVKIVSKVARHASIIKLHIDMISDFDPVESPKQLQDLKNRYGVLLWEDRKFADIASVTRRQITQGIHQISSWADIISVHSIAGPDIFKTSANCLGGCKIIVIGEMSSEGNLTDQAYLSRSLDMIDPLRENILKCATHQHTDINNINNVIIGIVTQTDIKTNLLKVTPGVRHDADIMNTDGSGQQYRKPSEVPWADIMVVGRGITDHIDSKDFESIVRQYC